MALGAVPNDCGPSSDEGSQGLCVPGQPYQAAVLPRGGYSSYPYQAISLRPHSQARPIVTMNIQIGEAIDHLSLQATSTVTTPPPTGRPLLEIAPDGYSGQRDDGSNSRTYGNYPAHTDDSSARPDYLSATPPIPIRVNSDPDAYERDRPPTYAGYPAQRGFGPPAPIVPGGASRRAYEAGSQPSAELPSEPP
jgi:hypothetical protein